MTAFDANRVQAIDILACENVIQIGKNWTSVWVRDLVENVCPKSQTFVIVTDDLLSGIGHLAELEEAFNSQSSEVSGSNKRVLSYVISNGESSKTREVKSQIEDFMLSHACTRDSCIIALGGGVVGDLAGFIASTFMRGIPFVQVPTTLLAMVDSSIGGKTAVDTPAGKNLIGSFWQPLRVYVDVKYLATLPKRQLVNGMAEVIKAAAIRDAELFRMLEIHVATILDDWVSFDVLIRIITCAIKIKAYVVTNDERESGLRGLLNFGHTIGHAIETIYAPELLHGEAVAIGMVKEAEISRHLGYLKQVNAARLTRLLKEFGLPTSLDDLRIKTIETDTPTKRWTVQNLLELMKLDKKNEGAQKKIVLLSTIGGTVEPCASNVSDRNIAKVVASSVSISPEMLKRDSIELKLPGSKSISNRVLLMCALGTGTCRIHGLLHSDDTQVMLQALKSLGDCKFNWENDGETLVITGSNGLLHPHADPIYLGNAGTAARFLTTVCNIVSTDEAKTKEIIITGNERMKQRPIGPLVDALIRNDCDITYMECDQCLPLKIRPTGLKGGVIKLSASVSSQYVSSILISAPYAQNPVTLILGGADDKDNHVVSQPYIDMTIAMMNSFGIVVSRDENSPNTYLIPQGSYMNPAEYQVEPDASSATYPLALAAIHGLTVTVHNMGSKSLQGDARFALDVLRPMGCQVSQDENATTVTGPCFGGLKPLAHVDMEPMTDAFLTASVLAAVCQVQNTALPDANVTKITGISNQRVKECNRIEAMVTELSKFGVEAWELDDGIAINGNSLLENAFQCPKNGVDCYDDHRVAMSFSVLASAVNLNNEKVIIKEKKCVEKTWPDWWDVLEREFGIKSEAAERSIPVPTCVAKLDPDSTIVLIGMRGVGKTSLGKMLTERLSYKFVDIDQILEVECGLPLREFIEKEGWGSFRALESKVFLSQLLANPCKTVISCGGGVLETETNAVTVRQWKNKGYVIFIERNIDHVVGELTAGSERPPLDQTLYQVYSRRLPTFQTCSNFQFNVIFDETAGKYDWPKINRQFVKQVKTFIGKDPCAPVESVPELIDNRVSNTDISFFVSLTCERVEDVIGDLSVICSGAHALELRIDCLKDFNDLDEVRGQCALLQYYSPLPLIFTVRTKGQGGKFPSNQPAAVLKLLELAFRMGFEHVDIEITELEDKDIQKLLQIKNNSLIIASFHDFSTKRPWVNKSDDMNRIVNRAARYGDIVKIVTTAFDIFDNSDIQDIAFPMVRKLGKPSILINMGTAGQLSRVCNLFMTPVTHPLLPSKAAPGQLSIAEIMKTRHLLGLQAEKQFFLFGAPISHSRSPVLHNGWFRDFGLDGNYLYQLFESDIVSRDMANLITGPNFGGASVTIPLKIDIMSVVDEVTPAAGQIGAVNTLIPKHRTDCKTKIIGDNTDWIGIKRVIERHASNSIGRVLIIGAGGTARAACFAAGLLDPSCSIFLWNRTLEKARVLCDHFGIEQLERLDVDIEFDVIVSTIPGGAQSELTTTFDHIFSKSKGLLVELAYKPVLTPFMALAEHHNMATANGLEVLQEQAKEQFKLWTGLPIFTNSKCM